MEMFAVDNTRYLMERLVFRILHRENARNLSHFKYIGFDWSGIPGWYLWPKQSSGVYALKERWSETHVSLVRAGFALHYYPSPEEEVFTEFSTVEQLVRVSDLFDRQGVTFCSSCATHRHEQEQSHQEPFHELKEGKGVPTRLARQKLRSSLFDIGIVRCGWYSQHLIQLEVESPVRSRTYAVEDILLATPDTNRMTTVVQARELDRNVPCWDLSWFFSKVFVDDLQMPYTVDRRCVEEHPDALCYARFTFPRSPEPS